MKYHKTVKAIKDLVEKNSMWYEYFEHEPVRTSEEAAIVRPEYSLSQGAKALIVRIKKRGGGKFFRMLVIPGDLKFDINKAKEHFEAKDIRFAMKEEVDELTDKIEFGGVPPLGNLFDLDVYADEKIFENDKIIFNAGDKRVSIAIKTSDYKTLVDPTILDLT